MHRYSIGLTLQDILVPASELARLRYVFEMQQVRGFYIDSEDSDSESSIIDGASSSGDIESILGTNDEAERLGWVYGEICDANMAEIFYRYGFRPKRSILFNLRQRLHNWDYVSYNVSIAYIWWLVEHGADLFLKSSPGPPACENDSESGIFGAHYGLFIAGEPMSLLDEPQFEELVSLNKLCKSIMRRTLTDNCECHCSTGGCSPFLWMTKGLIGQSWGWTGNINRIKKTMEAYYSRCGIDLAVSTHKTAIRYTTFQALTLNHTCCDPDDLIDEMRYRKYDESPWLGSDTVALINEEQAKLLELHEALVTELTEAAHEYLEDQSFAEFWGKTWIGRMEEELEKLDGCNLSDAERQGAERLGVRWCDPPPVEETKGTNPYEWASKQWVLFELDRICPD